MRNGIAVLAGLVLLMFAGCASDGGVTSIDINQIKLQELRRICLSCRGPHDWQCDEANLRNYLDRPATALCGGPSR